MYVGLLAWRYGYLPDKQNPEARSVTDIEYREAVIANKPRLIFLLDEAALWNPTEMDSHTGDGGSGTRIKAFRQELGADRLLSRFTSPDDLASKLAAAVYEAGFPPPCTERPSPPPETHP